KINQKLGDGAGANADAQVRTLQGDAHDGLGNDLVENARPRGHTQRDRPGQLALDMLQIVMGTAQLRGDRAGAAIEGLAEDGELDAPRSAIKEAHAKLFFKQTEAFAQSGLRDVQSFGCSAEASAFDDID